MFQIIIFFILIAIITNKSRKNQDAARPARPQAEKQTTVSRQAVSKQPAARTVIPNQPKKQTVRQSGKRFLQKDTMDSVPVTLATKEEIREHTHGSSYRINHSVGERYEEWMPIPAGKDVVRCSYCAADNLLPKGANAKHYTCYFCREEL